jgi:hypothetical protein
VKGVGEDGEAYVGGEIRGEPGLFGSLVFTIPTVK